MRRAGRPGGGVGGTLAGTGARVTTARRIVVDDGACAALDDQKKLLQAVGSRRAWCLGIIQKLAKIYTALHIRKWSDTVRQIFCSTRI